MTAVACSVGACRGVQSLEIEISIDLSGMVSQIFVVHVRVCVREGASHWYAGASWLRLMKAYTVTDCLCV